VPAAAPVRITIELGPRRVTICLALLAALNAFLLFTTDAVMEATQAGSLPAGAATTKLLRHLNLSYENVTATWYSSMLILAVALMAALCFAVDAAHASSNGAGVRERWLARAWLAVALVFTLLSLDELGSLHERIGGVPSLNLVSGVEVGWVYILALPIALVGAGLLAFAWVRLRKHPLVCVLFAAGTILYLSVPVLEHGENLVHEAAGWADDVKRPVFDFVREEGTELFGSLLFLAATAVYALQRTRDHAQRTRSAPAIVFHAEPRVVLAFTAVLVALGDLLMRASRRAVLDLPAIDSGIPNNWFPAALAAVAAFAALATRDRARATRQGGAGVYVGVAAYACLVSAYYGAHWRGWLNALRTPAWSPAGPVNGTLIAVAALLALFLARNAARGTARAASLALPLAMALALSGWGRTGDAGWVDYWACASLLFAIVAHLLERSPAEAPAATPPALTARPTSRQ
jgi:hypothetical protein